MLGTGAAAVGAAALWSVSGCASDATAKGLDALRAKLSGTLLLPRPTFATENQPANDEFAGITPSRSPCVDPGDVIACVNWCRRKASNRSSEGRPQLCGLLHDSRPAHQTDPHEQRDGRRCERNSHHRRRCSQQRTVGKRRQYELHGADRDVPEVGFTGLVLGGGEATTHDGGITADHLVSTDVVLANGSAVTASSAQNPDLSRTRWRGGNFGVHTKHVVSLVEIPHRQIGAFELKFRGIEDCIASFMAFDKIMHSAPDRLSGFLAVTNLNRPSGKASIRIDTRSRPSAVVHWACRGAQDLLRPLQQSAKAFTPRSFRRNSGRRRSTGCRFRSCRFTDWLRPHTSRTKALPATAVDQLIRRVASAPRWHARCLRGPAHVLDGRQSQHHCTGRDGVRAPVVDGLLRPAIWWQPTSSVGVQRDMQGMVQRDASIHHAVVPTERVSELAVPRAAECT